MYFRLMGVHVCVHVRVCAHNRAKALLKWVAHSQTPGWLLAVWPGPAHPLWSQGPVCEERRITQVDGFQTCLTSRSF